MDLASPEIMIVAGEASGDAHAAELIAALRQLHPPLRFFGCGGERMAAAGCELLVSSSELAVMGLVEVLAHLPRLHRLWRRLRQALLQRRPRGLILVDFPDFNLRLAAAARAASIPVVYFVSPQIWAWRRRRVKLIRRDVARMICIFPFEQAFYARQGLEVASVGHPLVERVERARASLPSAPAWRARLGAAPAAELIALLPGSRQRELDFHLPVLLAAAAQLRQASAAPPPEFVLPVAPHLSAAAIAAALPPALAPFLHLVPAAELYPALAHARLAFVASGTATVETALLATPMVVVYRLSPLSYRLGRRLVRTPHVAMVNLIAERAVVPELLQADLHPAALLAWAQRLLPDTAERRQMLADLAQVRLRLGPPGAIARAAAEVAATLHLPPSPGTPAPAAARLYSI
ncbi:MAG TPA: lipid-A-disaccharide synthase [Terriglobales bacterium]|nr:lipid-A-disaccharide synthase [Terriglobales bacterium]